MTEADHRDLVQWLIPGRCSDASAATADLGALKKKLAEKGVNGRGWRLYLDYGDAIFARLGRPWICAGHHPINAGNALDYLRLLQACEMDVLPPLELVASLASWRLPDDDLCSIPPLFFRAAWKAVVANQYSRRDPAECAAELTSVANWFFASGLYRTAEPGLLKAGWPALLRRQKAWLLEQPPSAASFNSRLADEWNPYVRRVDWGTYRFQALTTEAQLIDEGEAMQHCVGSYAIYCRAGAKRIYSVRERSNGRRVATLCVDCVPTTDGALVWAFEQMSGVKNAVVLSPHMFFAADAVLRAYSDLPSDVFSTPDLSVLDDDDEEEWMCDF